VEHEGHLLRLFIVVFEWVEDEEWWRCKGVVGFNAQQQCKSDTTMYLTPILLSPTSDPPNQIDTWRP
jgi:hypothetical protein